MADFPLNLLSSPNLLTFDLTTIDVPTCYMVGLIHSSVIEQHGPKNVKIHS